MASNDTTGTMKHNKQRNQAHFWNYDSKVQKTQNTESQNQNHDTQEVLGFFLRHKNDFSCSSSSLFITVIVAVTKEQLKYTEWPPGDAAAPTQSPNPLQFFPTLIMMVCWLIDFFFLLGQA